MLCGGRDFKACKVGYSSRYRCNGILARSGYIPRKLAVYLSVHTVFSAYIYKRSFDNGVKLFYTQYLFLSFEELGSCLLGKRERRAYLHHGKLPAKVGKRLHCIGITDTMCNDTFGTVGGIDVPFYVLQLGIGS